MSSTVADLAAELNRCRAAPARALPVRIGAGVLALLVAVLLAPASGIAAALVGAVLLAGGLWVGQALDRADAERRTLHVTYRPAPDARNSEIALAATATTLGRAAAVWLTGATWAGDTSSAVPLPNVSPARLLLGPPPGLAVAAPAWQLHTADEALFFLPDGILLQRDGRYVGYPYAVIAADCGLQRCEGTDIPADARIVARRWRYTRKDGGRDQRYRDNPQIIVADVGVVQLTGPGGFRRQLIVSDPDLAEFLAATLRHAAREQAAGAAPAAHLTAQAPLPPALARVTDWKFSLPAAAGLVMLSLLVGLASGGARPAASVAQSVAHNSPTEEADTWTPRAAASRPSPTLRPRALAAQPQPATAQPPTATAVLPATEPPATATPPPSPTPPPPTLTSTPTATPEPVTNTGANLRGGPGTDYPIVGTLVAGAPLKIVARTARADWYELEGGAWIAAFLVANPPAVVPEASVTPLKPTATPVPTATLAPPTPVLLYKMPEPAPPPARSCCKICTTGKACGNSCISRSKQCHQPPGCACDG